MKAKTRPKDQVKEFRKAARELGGDESEQRFQETLRIIAKRKPNLRPTKNRTKDG